MADTDERAPDALDALAVQQRLDRERAARPPGDTQDALAHRQAGERALARLRPASWLTGYMEDRGVPATPAPAPQFGESVPLGERSGAGTPETRAAVQGMAATRPGFAEIDAEEKAGQFSTIPEVNRLRAAQARAGLTAGVTDIEATGAAERAGFSAKLGAQEELSATRAAVEAQRVTDEQRLVKARDAHFASIDKRMTELGASKPVMQHWLGETAGQQVKNTLALIIGGLGGARGVENVMGILKNRVDNEMKRQRDIYEQGLAGLNTEQRQLQDVVAQLPTPEAKTTMLRTFALEQAIAHIDIEAAKRGIAATDARVLAAKKALTDEGLKGMVEGRIQNAIGFHNQAAAWRAAEAERNSPENQMKRAQAEANIDRTRSETGKAGADTVKALADAEKTNREATAGKPMSEGERSQSFIADRLSKYDSLTDEQKQAVKNMLPKDQRGDVEDPTSRKTLIAQHLASAGGGAPEAKPVGSSMAED